MAVERRYSPKRWGEDKTGWEALKGEISEGGEKGEWVLGGVGELVEQRLELEFGVSSKWVIFKPLGSLFA